MIEELFEDPEPLDENDPEKMEELFYEFEASGLNPEDLPNLTKAQKEAHAEYLT
jgi:hypothetical protein